MSDTVIEVENLSKKYIIGHQKQERYTALRDVIADGARSFWRSLSGGGSGIPENKEEFWALKDVSFEVKQGECIGIIGRNGAGKSTLLKILSRITEPTTGRIKIKGRVASLLEVGTGFHPELTGRENIFLNGSILGMSRAEIKAKFDEIVDFAEVEKFLDTPVKFYSSGMYTRLAFAVAAHLDTEILVVDEVLAVGDAIFQKKCLGKMGDVAGQEGKTIFFVSHNMKAIETLCKTAIILNQGKIQAYGEAHLLTKNYLSLHAETLYRLEKIWDSENMPGNNLIKIMSIRVIADVGYNQLDISCTTPIKVEIIYKILVEETPFILALHLKTLFGETVFATESKHTFLKQGIYKTECFIPSYLLNSRIYTFCLYFDRGYGHHLYKLEEDFLQFEVLEDLPRETGVPCSGDYPGVVRPNLKWQTSMIDYSDSLKSKSENETLQSDNKLMIN